MTIMGTARGGDARSCVAYHRSRPPNPGRATERPASNGLVPRSLPPSQISTRPEPLPLLHGQRDGRRRDHALDEWPPGPHHPDERFRYDEGDRAAPPADRGLRVHRAPHERRGAVLRDAPGEQLLEIGVPLGASRTAEDHRIDRVPGTTHCSDLAPARVAGVTRLDADDARHDAEEIVPGVHRESSVLDRVASLADERPHDGRMHRHLREHGDVAGARHVTRCIETVRSHEVRVVQADGACTLVHPRHESCDVAVGSGRRERIRGVVRALDERAFQKVAHRDLLSGSERYALLAHPGGRPRDSHHVVELQVLKRDDHRHQLRDACDRQRNLGVM